MDNPIEILSQPLSLDIRQEILAALCLYSELFSSKANVKEKDTRTIQDILPLPLNVYSQSILPYIINNGPQSSNNSEITFHLLNVESKMHEIDQIEMRMPIISESQHYSWSSNEMSQFVKYDFLIDPLKDASFNQICRNSFVVSVIDETDSCDLTSTKYINENLIETLIAQGYSQIPIGLDENDYITTFLVDDNHKILSLPPPLEYTKYSEITDMNEDLDESAIFLDKFMSQMDTNEDFIHAEEPVLESLNVHYVDLPEFSASNDLEKFTRTKSSREIVGNLMKSDNLAMFDKADYEKLVFNDSTLYHETILTPLGNSNSLYIPYSISKMNSERKVINSKDHILKVQPIGAKTVINDRNLTKVPLNSINLNLNWNPIGKHDDINHIWERIHPNFQSDDNESEPEWNESNLAGCCCTSSSNTSDIGRMLLNDWKPVYSEPIALLNSSDSVEEFMRMRGRPVNNSSEKTPVADSSVRKAPLKREYDAIPTFKYRQIQERTISNYDKVVCLASIRLSYNKKIVTQLETTAGLDLMFYDSDHFELPDIVLGTMHAVFFFPLVTISQTTTNAKVHPLLEEIQVLFSGNGRYKSTLLVFIANKQVFTAPIVAGYKQMLANVISGGVEIRIAMDNQHAASIVYEMRKKLNIESIDSLIDCELLHSKSAEFLTCSNCFNPIIASWILTRCTLIDFVMMRLEEKTEICKGSGIDDQSILLFHNLISQ